jgi:hypothetical protein
VWRTWLARSPTTSPWTAHHTAASSTICPSTACCPGVPAPSSAGATPRGALALIAACATRSRRGWQRGDGDGPAVGARRRGRTWRGGNRFEGGRSRDLCRRALASCLGGGEGRRGELGMGSCSVVPSPMWACGGSISGRDRGVHPIACFV